LRYRTLPHTADLFIEVYGSSVEELFANAAYGMFNEMLDVEAVTPKQAHKVDLEAETPEDLLVDWLSELLALFEITGCAFSRFDVKIGTRNSRWWLRAIVQGEPYDYKKHGSKVLIKAVTFHQLAIERKDSEYTARILFDI